MLRYALAFALLPVAAFAVGSDDSSAPTKPKCKMGQVYDPQTKKCLKADSSLIDDGERLQSLRAYAYAGELGAAQTVLDAMKDQHADAVLTYRGFLARKSGDAPAAHRWYTAALTQNPDNLLARSYMAQGMISEGDWVGAKRQYDEIIARGGKGSWAEISLAQAITTGATYDF